MRIKFTHKDAVVTITSILFFLCNLPVLTFANETSWELAFQENDLFPYRVTINPDNNNTIYVSTGEGIYKSTNKGGEWNKMTDGFVRKLIIDPNNSNIMYAGPKINSYIYSVYKSIDGGLSWNPANNFSGNMADIDIASENSNILFAGDF